MVREVVHIQVGQCGNQIGTKFWNTIGQEHGLAPDGTYQGSDHVQLEKIDVYYHESSQSTFVPRGVLVDMENSVLNHITSRTYGKMFRPENYISSTDGAANCFMKGCYSDEAIAIAGRVVDTLRLELERSDCCQGYTFSHSAAGGTGSGLTMQIFDQIVNADLLKPSFGGMYFFTVLPSTKISNTVIEPYNTCLVLEKLSEAENVVCLDNEALYRICYNTLELDSPTFGDMNRCVAHVMAGNTASFRFPGVINTDMNKLSYSLRARPFQHYYIPSFAPLTSLRNQRYRTINVADLVSQMTLEENMMVECKIDQQDIDAVGTNEEMSTANFGGKTFAYAALFRGSMTTSEVDEALTFLRGNTDLEQQIRRCLGYNTRMSLPLEKVRSSQFYVEENPRPVFSTITNFAPPGMPMSCTYLRNSSVIKHKFLKIIREACRMFSTNSFAHWFDAEKYNNCPTLEACLDNMSSTWIAEFGVQDLGEWPQPLNRDEINERMLQKE